MVVVLWHVMAAEVCGNLGFLQTVYLVVQNAHDVHLCIVLKACNHLHKTHNQLTEKRTISELETKLKTGEAAHSSGYSNFGKPHLPHGQL
jgi:hypothetical protein